MFQVSICYCFWFDLFVLFVSGFYLLLFLIDLFVLFVSGFYLLLFLIWPFRTVCFRFLSVIVIDLTFSYCLFQVSICYCCWFDLFVLFVSGFYLLLFLIWPFRTVCFRFLSVIVFDLTFSYCLFQVSICYCFWFDLFVLFVSGFYLLLFLIWLFRTVWFRFLSVIVIDFTFSKLFASGFYLLLFLIWLFSTVCFRILSVIVFDWPFRTVCLRFLSAIVFDLTFLHCLLQVSICYCFWFDLLALFASGFYLLLFLINPFVLFVSGFYLLLFLIWPFRTVCFRFLSVIVFDLTFSYCLFQVSICYCFWFDLFVLFVSGFYLLLFLIWLFRTVWFRFLSVIVIDLTFSKLFASGFYLLLLLIWPFRNCLLQVSICYCFWLTFSYCLFQVSICYCFWFDLFALFVAGFYLLLFLIWPFSTVCFRILSVIVFD